MHHTAAIKDGHDNQGFLEVVSCQKICLSIFTSLHIHRVLIEQFQKLLTFFGIT